MKVEPCVVFCFRCSVFT